MRSTVARKRYHGSDAGMGPAKGLKKDWSMAEKALVYLACPYSHPERNVRLARFDAANRCAGALMKKGLHVFSPISHTHPIAEACDLPLGWDYWHAYDRAILECCEAVYILCIPGWNESKGIRAEIEIAIEFGLSVLYVNQAGERVEPMAGGCV